MAMFKMRVDFENQTVAKAKGNKISDFDNVIKGLKKKFGGKE